MVVLAAATISGATEKEFVWLPSNGGNGHIYRFVLPDEDMNVTWEQAKIASSLMDRFSVPGHLATITSSEENDFIRFQTAYLMQPIIPGVIESDKAWMGLSDTAIEGQYEWITGEPFVFSAWFDGEPNNYGGDEDYVTYSNLQLANGGVSFGWNDEMNSVTRGRVGYLAEFDVFVPEPASSLFVMLTLLSLLCLTRPRR
ncbi:MAG: lectin-like protein [Pirellulales bacterium]